MGLMGRVALPSICGLLSNYGYHFWTGVSSLAPMTFEGVQRSTVTKATLQGIGVRDRKIRFYILVFGMNGDLKNV